MMVFAGIVLVAYTPRPEVSSQPLKFTSIIKKCNRPLGVSTLMYRSGQRCRGMSDLLNGVAISYSGEEVLLVPLGSV